MGISAPVTTDALVSIVGMRADVITKSNKEELERRLVHSFIKELTDGDVLWPVRDTVKRRIHLCAVKVGKTPDQESIGLLSREKGEEHQGPVSIVDGVIVLQTGGKRFDMLTCRLLATTN